MVDVWRKIRSVLGRILPVAIAILCVGTVAITFVVVYNDRQELIKTNQALIEQVRSTGQTPVVDSPNEVIQGQVGATGSPGPQGERGPKGDMGERGQTGPQGIKGDTGDSGPQGLPGVSGSNGQDGARGASGPQGAPGEAGPQGVQGAPGPQGATGPAGPAGPGITNVSCQGMNLVFYGPDGMSVGSVSAPQVCIMPQ